MADATGFDAAFPYRAVLFDLDGTLVDTEDDIVEAVNRTLGDWRLGPRTATEVHGWIGEGARMLIERAFRAAGSDADIDAVMPDLMRHYAETLLLGARLYPGAEPVLRGLRARGVRLALCTNKPSRFLLPLMRHLGVADVFDAMVGGEVDGDECAVIPVGRDGGLGECGGNQGERNGERACQERGSGAQCPCQAPGGCVDAMKEITRTK